MIYPIRIDASSADHSVKLVDTLLIDPFCLPIQPDLVTNPILSLQQSHPCMNSREEPSTEPVFHTLRRHTLNRNAKFLASTILADMEVQGVVKVHKSFVGRLKLISCPALQERVESQIRDQLSLILDKEFSSALPLPHFKRKREVEEIGLERYRKQGRKTYAVGDNSTIDNKMKQQHISLKKNERESGRYFNVNVRLRENDIVVKDEILLDPSYLSINPILLAKSLAKDLNVPEKMVNSLAISISEQICGINVKRDVGDLITILLDNVYNMKNYDNLSAAVIRSDGTFDSSNLTTTLLRTNHP
mmetsp:Transcript_21270/g.29828  ORF Transcript_21270/g.29828 Transcript_21270/m.29828 type:complete len:303 (+) Transcript_21270:53-961(+)